jgi:hypothetical protein
MTKTDWKSKSAEYAYNNKQSKKRIKELTKSRDEWKAKSIYHKARADKLAADIKKVKNKLSELIEIQ